MRYLFILGTLLTSSVVFSAEHDAEEKHHEDPTKVITKLGIGYTDEFTFSGSLALDSVRKLNARTNQDATEWNLGGSWLFDFGILNFSLGRSEYDNGGKKENYSLGTFLPLNAFGIDTGKWMIFPMAGINHNKIENTVIEEPDSFDEVITQQNTNNGGYLGSMFLRPLSEHWTAMAFAGGGLGSDSYSNLWAGAGASYKLNDMHSLNLFGFFSEDDYGSISKLNINYTYEFD